MKFGALLRSTASELPEITCLFDTYKQLKKKLKRLPDKSQVSAAAEDVAQQQALTVEEAEFVATIDGSLANLNNMFMEKEEEAVIRLEQLQAGAIAAKNDEQRRSVYRELVDFHGEVLLLVHWSVLAYTATVKILKKHHKRTGLLLRAPQLQNLLSQPFCSTELMTQLAHKAEECVQELVGLLASSATSPDATSVLEDAMQPRSTAAPACTSPAAAPVELLPPASTIGPNPHHPFSEQTKVAMGEVEAGQAPGTPDQQQSAAQGQTGAGRHKGRRQGSGQAGASNDQTDVGSLRPRPVQQQGEEPTLEHRPSGGSVTSGEGRSQPQQQQQQGVERSGAPSAETTDVSLSPDDDDDDDDDSGHGDGDVAGTALAMANAVAGVVDAARKRMRVHHAAVAAGGAAVGADLAGRQDESANNPTTGNGHSSDMAEYSAAGSVQGHGGAGDGQAAHHAVSAAGAWASGQQDMLRRTQVALDTWSQLRTTASTPSTVLPPDAQLGVALQLPQHSPSGCQQQQQQATTVGSKRPRSETSETAIASS